MHGDPESGRCREGRHVGKADQGDRRRSQPVAACMEPSPSRRSRRSVLFVASSLGGGLAREVHLRAAWSALTDRDARTAREAGAGGVRTLAAGNAPAFLKSRASRTGAWARKAAEDLDFHRVDAVGPGHFDDPGIEACEVTARLARHERRTCRDVLAAMRRTTGDRQVAPRTVGKAPSHHRHVGRPLSRYSTPGWPQSGLSRDAGSGRPSTATPRRTTVCGPPDAWRTAGQFGRRAPAARAARRAERSFGPAAPEPVAPRLRAGATRQWGRARQATVPAPRPSRLEGQ